MITHNGSRRVFFDLPQDAAFAVEYARMGATVGVLFRNRNNYW
ncbi:MAG: hypothetical protein PHS97_00485 [Oscillospiraceae bacterium]|nr:hypothetical protein [Oscillospiraceae bacterium]